MAATQQFSDKDRNHVVKFDYIDYSEQLVVSSFNIVVNISVFASYEIISGC